MYCGIHLIFQRKTSSVTSLKKGGGLIFDGGPISGDYGTCTVRGELSLRVGLGRATI